MKQNRPFLYGWLLAFALIFSAAFLSAQTLTPAQWDEAKKQGQLDGKAKATILVSDSVPFVARIAPNVPVQPATTSCSCWQTRDATYAVAPFTNGLAPDYRNDDGSTVAIPLPFSFCLYGQTWNSLYINNNGNVSFGSAYSTFTASGFPNAAFVMVAPFWSDVDTRGAGSGLVYYKITPTYMVVQWDSVGYYNSHTNLRNTFQLIISDGNDPIIPNGNVSFCYKDMQWTTGDASQGSGGFNGADAVVGANSGDGINYIQFGAFNQPGSTYNGPNGANSGIDWLDNQSFTFDACTNSNNIPPTLAGLTACDTLRICQGDSLPINPEFFSPEVGQITTITVSAPGVNGYNIISNTPGNTAQLISYIIGQANNIGNNTITITATDDGTPNATTIIQVVVIVTASPTSSVTTTNATCNSNNGSATVTASGGSGNYTYSWSPSGGTGATATGLGAGTYTCTITDAATGCSTRQVAVIGGSGNITLSSNTTNITCNGNTGSITVNPSGGTAPYTYSWSTGGTGATESNLPAGSYTVTITDANTCSLTQTFTLTQPSALSVTPSQTNVSCNGGATGSATVSVSGGTAGYTYAWSPSGGTGATASNLTAGNYTVTINDANSCTTTQSFAITEPPALTCSITAVNSACSGGSLTAVPSGGTGPYNYSWSNLSGSPSQSNLPSGNYTVTITDANGCTTTQSATITAPAPLAASTSWNGINCYGDLTGSAGVVASGGTPSYTYAWAPSGGTNATATGLGAGTYTCTITDANNCTITRVFTITQPPQLTTSATQTNNLCNGDNTGAATVSASGGVSGYTYSWSPSGGTAATANNLAAGAYVCTVTDGNGCTATQSVTITAPPALTGTVSVVNAGCLGPGSASVNIAGGTGGYSYSWSSGGTAATENNLAQGTYTCTITDANGCTLTQIANVGYDPSVTATASSNDATCFGGATGSATVVPSGGTAPYSYAWSPSGGSNATATGLSAGTYTCTITDANGCTTTQSVTISEPAQLTASSAGTNVSCNGQSNGTAGVLAAGGTPGYTYQWAPSGGTAQTATGLAAGTYTCTITDANGCTTTQSVTVTQPTALTATMNNDAVCLGLPSQINANGNGGVAPYTYVWSNGPTGASQTVNATTTTSYTVTITDANGCTTTGVSTVTVNPLPIASATSNAVDGIYVVSPNTDLCFTGQGAGITGWNWILQNGTSSQQSPCVTITAADTGSYCATLIATTQFGCPDTAEICVLISNADYSVPNVFTPNGDGSNDAFIVTNTGMKTFHCIIYDRWGALIYEWDSPTGNWDGKTKNGNEAVDGVYYWTLSMQDYSGKLYDDHGFVHLIRGTK